ncbi:MAG TPA: TRAP transporter TatT component family protein [Anaeromyxobacteraceae bacterium]|nr:TRAP transporter TatT component family protein [Anaeromyxobacteraceae bacterium]
MANRKKRLLFSVAALLLAAGCKTVATNAVADAVSESGGTYASDGDPELVKAAVPFGLKTMEGLLVEVPTHDGLLRGLASGFTQYSYAFVLQDADLAEWSGRAAEAKVARDRARKLFLRARDYGLRGLEQKYPGLPAKLKAARDLEPVLAVVRKEDVGLLYWTAAAWALAVSTGKGDMQLVAELPAPVAMMRRGLALDESYDHGAFHEFFVTWDGSRSPAEGGGPARAKEHLDRALALSDGEKLGPLVSYAETVLVQTQDRGEFVRVLEQVLAADVNAAPQYRLANVLAQRRARALLEHADDFFA